jgi:hypothetical protein
MIDSTSQKNPHLLTLRIVSSLAGGDQAPAEIMEREGISSATLKRHIADARDLGAAIVSVKKASRSYYRLDNYDTIKRRLNSWIELETTRDLRDQINLQDGK